MNKLFFLSLISFGFFSYSYDVATQLPAGVAGAPNESRCSQCHNSFNTAFNSNRFGVVFGNGNTQYENDSTYLIDIIVNGVASKNYGFQAIIKDVDGNNIGTFTPIGSTTTVKEGYISHTNVNINKVITKYSFYWKAPSKASFTDSLHFYMAGVIGNNAGGNKGDSVLTKDFPIYRKKDLTTSIFKEKTSSLVRYHSLSQIVEADPILFQKAFVVYAPTGAIAHRGIILEKETPLQLKEEGIYYFVSGNTILPLMYLR